MRNYLSDWECLACHRVHEHLIKIDHDPPASHAFACCQGDDLIAHRRLMSRPAAHDPKPIRTLVAGGSLDTAGMKALTPLPLLPDECRDSLSAMKDFWSRPEYKEAKRKRKVEKMQNRMKKKRAELIRQGAAIDLRVDKLPGDPKSL